MLSAFGAVATSTMRAIFFSSFSTPLFSMTGRAGTGGTKAASVLLSTSVVDSGAFLRSWARLRAAAFLEEGGARSGVERAGEGSESDSEDESIVSTATVERENRG